MSTPKKRTKRPSGFDQAEMAVAKDLGFLVRKTGSFLDYPTNKKPAYCYDRGGEWIAEARPEAVKLWDYAVKLKAEELRLEKSEL